MGSIYLDYNATAPPEPAVIDAVTRAMRDLVGNASSVHRDGQRAKSAVEEARAQVAALVNARPGEIVFTSGGSESDNLALRGVVPPALAAGRRRLVVSAIEHDAVLATARALVCGGVQLDVLLVPESGLVESDRLREVECIQTALVSVMLANNETGVIQPVARLAEIAKAHGAIVHSDAVQAAGRIPIDVGALGIDLLSLSAHKFGGPKGVGALWVKPGTPLTACLTGGRQERRRRAGTENVPAIVGMGVAADLARTRLHDEANRLRSLRDHLEVCVRATIPDTSVNGCMEPRLPNTSNLSFAGVDAETLLIGLDLEGVSVSTGSACSSGSIDPSHVLMAMGLPPSRVQSAIRFSLGAGTTRGEIERVATLLPGLVARLRAARGATARSEAPRIGLG